MATNHRQSSNHPHPRSTKRVNLALQGGGAHGAFTWGVIEALLDDGRLVFEGLSGTSAGAMNAAVLASGLALGGPRMAKERLENFWRAVSIDGELGEGQRALFDAMLGAWGYGSERHNGWFDLATRIFSPYQNPIDLNPLRGAVERFVDCQAVRGHESLKLFIAATNVYSGKVRVFRREELSADVLMASACLPMVFKAVEIEGEPYWDGGYSGNPALSVLYEDTDATDLVIVGINPFEKADRPTTSREIISRIDQISFNSNFLLELKAIARMEALVESKALKDEGITPLFMHRIAADEELTGLGASSKLNNDLDFLLHLREIGRGAAAGWLAEHRDSLGKRSSLNLDRLIGETRRDRARPRRSA